MHPTVGESVTTTHAPLINSNFLFNNGPLRAIMGRPD